MRTAVSRLAVGASLAIGLAWAPAGTVLACSCLMLPLPEAVRQADFAFIGTVIAVDEPEPNAGDAIYTFTVERARDDMVSPFTLESVFGSDANCGFDMAVGERWLIIASTIDGPPSTSLCSGSARADTMDDVALAVTDAALVVHPNPAPTGFNVPMPIVVIVATAVLIGLASVAAFRRNPAS
jgi:hypothetical protein